MSFDIRAALGGEGRLEDEKRRVRECKICAGESRFFAAVDFGKSCDPSLYPLGRYGVEIPYSKCSRCGFIFTCAFDEFTADQWSSVIYNSEYIKVDPAYSRIRPALNAFMIEAYLKASRGDKVGLDFGGGNGLAASLLRDRGWNYDSFDPFGDDHRKAGSRYDFCSAFEVFEHVPDPMRSLKEILGHCSNERLFIVIGTNVSDGIVTPDTGLEWWYAAPRNGHISLYTHKSLSYLAQREGLSYLSLGKNLHFLSRGYSRMEIFRIALEGKGRRIINKKALSSFLRAAERAN